MKIVRTPKEILHTFLPLLMARSVAGKIALINHRWQFMDDLVPLEKYSPERYNHFPLYSELIFKSCYKSRIKNMHELTEHSFISSYRELYSHLYVGPFDKGIVIDNIKRQQCPDLIFGVDIVNGKPTTWLAIDVKNYSKLGVGFSQIFILDIENQTDRKAYIHAIGAFKAHFRNNKIKLTDDQINNLKDLEAYIENKDIISFNKAWEKSLTIFKSHIPPGILNQAINIDLFTEDMRELTKKYQNIFLNIKNEILIELNVPLIPLNIVLKQEYKEVNDIIEKGVDQIFYNTLKDMQKNISKEDVSNLVKKNVQKFKLENKSSILSRDDVKILIIKELLEKSTNKLDFIDKVLRVSEKNSDIAKTLRKLQKELLKEDKLQKEIIASKNTESSWTTPKRIEEINKAIFKNSTPKEQETQEFFKKRVIEELKLREQLKNNKDTSVSTTVPKSNFTEEVD